MNKHIKNIFKKNKKPSSEFSRFFTQSSKKERVDFLLEVAKGANEKQRKLVEKHDRLYGTK
tara:strand:+ start:261 stop:443 length:183 start_codon:yes stop_codon:yes gene_type:complete